MKKTGRREVKFFCSLSFLSSKIKCFVACFQCCERACIVENKIWNHQLFLLSLFVVFTLPWLLLGLWREYIQPQHVICTNAPSLVPCPFSQQKQKSFPFRALVSAWFMCYVFWFTQFPLLFCAHYIRDELPSCVFFPVFMQMLGIHFTEKVSLLRFLEKRLKDIAPRFSRMNRIQSHSSVALLRCTIPHFSSLASLIALVSRIDPTRRANSQTMVRCERTMSSHLEKPKMNRFDPLWHSVKEQAQQLELKQAT